MYRKNLPWVTLFSTIAYTADVGERKVNVKWRIGRKCRLSLIIRFEQILFIINLISIKLQGLDLGRLRFGHSSRLGLRPGRLKRYPALVPICYVLKSTTRRSRKFEECDVAWVSGSVLISHYTCDLRVLSHQFTLRPHKYIGMDSPHLTHPLTGRESSVVN